MLVMLLITDISGQETKAHGPDFKMDCKLCHDPGGWKVDFSKLKYDHATTGFPLEGQHAQTQCRQCHQDLVFNKAKPDCISCHQDIHQMTVGNDCKRCHTSNDWLVNNITELHEQSGFPLAGAHNLLNCIECHKNETNQRWDRIGNECIACHQQDFNRTKSPDHKAAGFSNACAECHDPVSLQWSGSGNFHGFFPLTLGHDIKDCNRCHQGNNYAAANPDCKSCHMADYSATVNPNHAGSGFGTDCAMCHSTQPGWKPAKMENHDQAFFPIYSGNHKGEWSKCTDCHLNPGNYSQFSCINCHEHSNQANMAKEHKNVNGYVFQSNACLACHPKGD